jgi:hypothetical protein
MFHKLKQIRKIPKASARKLTKINIVFVLPFCVNHYDFLVNSQRLQGHKAKQGLEVPLPPIRGHYLVPQRSCAQAEGGMRGR